MDFKEKLKRFQEALSTENDSKKKYNIFNKIIKLYKENSNYKDVLETYFTQSQFCIEQIKISDEKKYWKNNLAESDIFCSFILLFNLFNNKKALDLLQKAHRILKKTNNLKLLGLCFIGFGFIWRRVKNYQKARESFYTAMDYLNEAKDTDYLNTVINELANIYYYEHDLQKSIEYHKKAIDMEKTSGNFATYAVLDLGLVYIELGEYEEALNCFQEILDKTKFLDIVTYTYNNIVKLYLEKNDLENALKYNELAFESAKIIKDNNALSEIHESFSLIYEKLQKYDMALKHYKKHIEYSYLLDDIETNNKITALQINFDWEQKQKELEIIHIKNNELEKVNSELKNHRKHLQKINKILRQDIFDNLHSIEKNLYDFRQKKDDDHLIKIENTLKRSINLIYQIRELETFLDTHANLTAFIINDIINDVIMENEFAYFEKSEKIKILAKNDIKLMFKLLIENMIQVRHSTKIMISISKIKGNCKITIQDNGIDIAEDLIKKILLNNQKQNENDETSDLLLVKKLIEDSGGFIFFDKNELQGYTFTIVLRSIE